MPKAPRLRGLFAARHVLTKKRKPHPPAMERGVCPSLGELRDTVNRHGTVLRFYDNFVQKVRTVNKAGLDALEKLLGLCGTPGLVRVHHFKHANGVVTYEMDRLWMQTEPPCEEQMSQLQQAVDVAHTENLFNGNIGPDNVALDDSGRLTLFNFDYMGTEPAAHWLMPRAQEELYAGTVTAQSADHDRTMLSLLYDDWRSERRSKKKRCSTLIEP
jgi:hypothetical protein